MGRATGLRPGSPQPHPGPASGRAAAAPRPPVHGELPVLLHRHGHPVQGACVVGRVDGPQREHAFLAIPETGERHVSGP